MVKLKHKRIYLMEINKMLRYKLVGINEAKLLHAFVLGSLITPREFESIRVINDMNGGCSACGI